MKLHYFPLSTYSQKALIALYEKEIPFEPEVVQMMDPAAMAVYSETYPLGKVPLLVLDDGYKIPESTIIVEYLETHHKTGTSLIPSDPDTARKVRFYDRMSDLYLNNPVVTLLFQQIKMREYMEVDLEKARKQLSIACEHLNQNLSDHKWLVGDDFSLADCAAIPALYYMQHVFPTNELVHLNRYWQQAQERESYRKVQAEFVPIWQGMMAKASP